MCSGGRPGNDAPPQTSPAAWAHQAARAGGVDGMGTLAGSAEASVWVPRAALRHDPI